MIYTIIDDVIHHTHMTYSIICHIGYHNRYDIIYYIMFYYIIICGIMDYIMNDLLVCVMIYSEIYHVLCTILHNI